VVNSMALDLVNSHTSELHGSRITKAIQSIGEMLSLSIEMKVCIKIAELSANWFN